MNTLENLDVVLSARRGKEQTRQRETLARGQGATDGRRDGALLWAAVMARWLRSQSPRRSPAEGLLDGRSPAPHPRASSTVLGQEVWFLLQCVIQQGVW